MFFRYTKYQLYPIITDLSDFKMGQIFGAPMVSANVNKTVQMFGISRGTVSKLMIAFEKEKKTSQQSTFSFSYAQKYMCGI